MQKIWLSLGLFAILTLTGAGCDFTSLEDASGSADSEQLADVQKENADLKASLKDLQKQVDKLEQKADTKKEDPKDEEDLMNEDENIDEDREVNDRGRDVLAENAYTELEDNQIQILAVSSVAPDAANNYEDPYFKFGCEEYLYPVLIELEEEKGQSDLATALVQLLTRKDTDLPDAIELTNPIRGKGLTLENVRYEDGVRIIELEGEPTVGGVCEAERLKAVIEETIALYSEDFEIILNGGAKQWDCLFDTTGECN